MIKNNKMRYLISAILFSLFIWTPIKAQLSMIEIMYNNPGEDIYEYIKVLNVTNQPLNLSDFSMTAGIEASFPNEVLNGGSWFFVVSDSTSFVDDLLSNYSNFTVVQGTGALNNGGETITIIQNSSGQVVDEVTYDDENGWPTFADGNGPPLNFCGNVSDDKNDPSLWTTTTFNTSGSSHSQLAGITISGVATAVQPLASVTVKV